jgi:hypothetical protein
MSERTLIAREIVDLAARFSPQTRMLAAPAAFRVACSASISLLEMTMPVSHLGQVLLDFCCLRNLDCKLC